MDGTLLHSDGKISKNSYDILQPLIDRGLPFAIATGRTRDNAIGALAPLKLKSPMICDNGSMIYDPLEGKFINKKILPAAHSRDAISLIQEHNISPFINTYDGGSLVIYYSTPVNEAQDAYYTKRSAYGLSKYIKDESYTRFRQDAVFNFSMLDTYENLIGLFDKFKENKNYTSLMFPAEFFEGYYWLEILPANSGKGQAIDFLKEKYRPEKVVCFGDNLNDLCMFERADVKVAPSNAVAEIRKAADIVIGHCDDDSVARFISKHMGDLENNPE